MSAIDSSGMSEESGIINVIPVFFYCVEKYRDLFRNERFMDRLYFLAPSTR